MVESGGDGGGGGVKGYRQLKSSVLRVRYGGGIGLLLLLVLLLLLLLLKFI